MLYSNGAYFDEKTEKSFAGRQPKLRILEDVKVESLGGGGDKKLAGDD